MKLHQLTLAALLCLPFTAQADTNRYTVTDEFTEKVTEGLYTDSVFAKKPASFPYAGQEFRLYAMCQPTGNKHQRRVVVLLKNSIEFNTAPNGLYGIGTSVEFKVDGKKVFKMTGAVQNGLGHDMHFFTRKADGKDAARLMKYLDGAESVLIRFHMFNGEPVVIEMPIANLSQYYNELTGICKK